jgi:hypothetical protein
VGAISPEHDVLDDDERSHERPPPDAYGRVTNPERFIIVQEAAAGLLDRLEQTYLVRRSKRSPTRT